MSEIPETPTVLRLKTTQCRVNFADEHDVHINAKNIINIVISDKPHLKKLWFDCFKLQTLKIINCPNLTHFTLSNIPKLHYFTFENTPNITHFNVFHSFVYNDSRYKFNLNQFPKLTHLSWNAPNRDFIIDNEFLEELTITSTGVLQAMSSVDFQYAPALKSVNLSDCDVLNFPFTVSSWKLYRCYMNSSNTETELY